MPNLPIAYRIFLASLCLIPFFRGASSSRGHGDGKRVTYGSAIKLRHLESGGKYYLSSQEQNYGTGSGQQLVTLAPKKNEHKTFWMVSEGNNEEERTSGTPVRCGSVIRLTHVLTTKNVHSHLHKSILTGQQEVSAFGDNGIGDEGDDWKVVCNGDYWERDRDVQFMHIQTIKYIGGALRGKFDERNCGNCPILHHLECFARARMDEYTKFQVDLGVHLSV